MHHSPENLYFAFVHNRLLDRYWPPRLQGSLSLSCPSLHPLLVRSLWLCLSLSVSPLAVFCCGRSSQPKTTDYSKRKKKQGGSGYMVNPVSNTNITLDQILAVEFLQQTFRRRVAQR